MGVFDKLSEFVNGKPKGFYDVHLLQREYYNPNKFAVHFELMQSHVSYVIQSKKATGPHKAICEPNGFLYLPHGYYVITAPGFEYGQPIDLVVNLEKKMFKGNKMPDGGGLR